MVNQSRSSDPMDPLHSHSGLSMFPRTIRDSTKPKDLDQIESIHNYMKSMALRSPIKLLDQAKIIVHGSELLNSDLASFVAAENKDEAVAAKGKDNPQERRPALGRKRARFSLKPNSSQPSLSLESCLDITQLQDPEEYFLAHEKLDNAKKELERQKGGIGTDLNEYRPSKTARHRRPGILGKSVSFKHRQYSTVLSETEDASLFSQEPLEQDILSPNYVIQPETTCPNVESNERELAGSITKTEKRVTELLDELLSSDCENLDEDGALSFLQEALQIKPICLNKLCLPDLHDIGRNNCMPLAEKSPKPQKILSDIHNLVIDQSGRTSAIHKLMAETPRNLLASPSPPKSPFASLTLLQKHILRSNQSGNLSSAFNLDLSTARNPSADNVDEQSDHVDSKEDLTVLESKSLTIESLKPMSKNPLNLVASPSLPKSPFASISLPRKQIVQSNLLRNPFSSLNMDLSPVKNLPPTDNADKQSDHVVSKEDLTVSESKLLTSESHKPMAKNPLNPVASPSLPKSPFASVSLPRKQILQSNLLSNPFSSLDMDLSPVRNLPPTDNADEQSDHVGSTKALTVSKKLKSATIEKDNVTVANMGTLELTTSDPVLFDKSAKENSRRVSIGIDVWSSGSDNNLECNNGGGNIDERHNDDDINLPITDAHRNESHEVQENVEDTLRKAVSSAQPDINVEGPARLSTDTEFQPYGTSEMEENVEDTVNKGVSSLVPDINIEGSTTDNFNSTQSQLDRTSPAAVEQHAMDGHPEVCPEKHIEEPSGISSNEQSKEKIPQRNGRKRKAFYHRQSLAAAGTCWESGVRRSSRIKMRPLEYWKGERFLYGRIHKSMTTVIGVKYVSPGKGDGKHNMRVKSYISDEYKELVELAALH